MEEILDAVLSLLRFATQGLRLLLMLRNHARRRSIEEHEVQLQGIELENVNPSIRIVMESGEYNGAPEDNFLNEVNQSRAVASFRD